MTKNRGYDRRSFLARVIGGTVGGSTLMVLGRRAAAFEPITGEGRLMSVDADPSDPAREPAPDAEPTRTTLGVTDDDRGSSADPAGRGRGGRRRAGISDSDSGPAADAAGRGRGAPPQPSAAPAAPRESFVICPGHPRCPR